MLELPFCEIVEVKVPGAWVEVAAADDDVPVGVVNVYEGTLNVTVPDGVEAVTAVFCCVCAVLFAPFCTVSAAFLAPPAASCWTVALLLEDALMLP